MKYGLPESAVQKIHGVLRRYPQVQQAILYGSRAKGNYTTGSDVDLTLVGGEDLTLEVLYRIMDEVDDLLLPYTFDWSIYHHMSDPKVRDHIKSTGVVFYAKGAAVHEST